MASVMREIVLPDGSIRLRAVKPETGNERRLREDGLLDAVVKCIEAYEKSSAELETGRLHLANAQSEEDLLLLRETVTDDEIRVRNSQTVVARNAVVALESVNGKTWSSLEMATEVCHPVYSQEQISRMATERARIAKAVSNAAEWSAEDEEDPRRQNVMWGIWALSRPIQVIGSLAPSPFRSGLWPSGDSRLLIASKELLTKWKMLRELESK
jgi:hypothetical protein